MMDIIVLTAVLPLNGEDPFLSASVLVFILGEFF